MDDSNIIEALSALAQPSRLKAFRLLVEKEPEGIAAGELARIIGVPQNTMSTHLSILANAGLITSERLSRSIVYRYHRPRRLRKTTPTHERYAGYFAEPTCTDGLDSHNPILDRWGWPLLRLWQRRLSLALAVDRLVVRLGFYHRYRST